MPVFTAIKGHDVFVPSTAVVMAEAPSGLTTLITFAMPNGLGQIEVHGTCQAVGAVIVAELTRER